MKLCMALKFLPQTTLLLNASHLEGLLNWIKIDWMASKYLSSCNLHQFKSISKDIFDISHAYQIKYWSYGCETFSDNDKAAKHSERKRMFCGLVIIIKNFNFINSGGLGHPIRFHIFFILAFFSPWLLLPLHQGCFGWDFTPF